MKKERVLKSVLLPPPWLKIWDNHRWIIISDDTKWYSTLSFSPRNCRGIEKWVKKAPPTHKSQFCMYSLIEFEAVFQSILFS
jgi:hypothetical protein